MSPWLLLALILLIWIALAVIVAPLVGAFLHRQDTFGDDHDRERIGLSEPSPLEHFVGERRLARERAERRHKSRPS